MRKEYKSFFHLKFEIFGKESWRQRRKEYKCLHFIILKQTIRNENNEHSQKISLEGDCLDIGNV